MLRNIDKQTRRANPSRADKCQSGSYRGTSHKLIDHKLPSGHVRTVCEALRYAQDDRFYC
jgi:hypothetical protein